MKDSDLKALSNVAAAPPSADARRRAMDAAMDAYDDALFEKSFAPGQKNHPSTQGSGIGARLTSIFTPIWSTLMTLLTAPLKTPRLAALLVTGVIALPIATILTQDLLDRQDPTEISLQLDIETATPARAPEALGDTYGEAVVEPAPIVPPKGNDNAQTAQIGVIAESAPATSAGATRNRGNVTTNDLAVGLGSSSRLNHNAVTPNAPVHQRPTPGAQGVLGVQNMFSKQTADQRLAIPEGQHERYERFEDNAVTAVSDKPVSTFSIDVDTASYSRVRAFLNTGALPPRDMVRVEEMINYFDYAYPLPSDRSQPFKPTVTMMPTPWNADTKLMHIGIKGFDIPAIKRPKANLVFLIDVSGSMSQQNKLPLVVNSFRLLLNELNPEDTLSIVTYAGQSVTVLEPTPASEKAKVLAALEKLQAGGATAGQGGILRAYQLAEENFVKDGVNRVMLATDGDFNVGFSDPDQLKDLIAKKRKSGIYLSVLGFGQGNYNDALMQSLAQNGNGIAAYIDTLAEAQKTLVEESSSALFPIASDVKIQVEFNPAKVAEYRLIGYETRALNREDFNNDKVDAGEIGSGHTVTALYEVTPVGSPAVLNDPLRYGSNQNTTIVSDSDELAFLRVRYKLPGEAESKLIEQPVADDISTAENVDATFSVSVAAFAQKLRGNPALDDLSYEDIAGLASENRGTDRFGYRSAFVRLVNLADSLSK